MDGVTLQVGSGAGRLAEAVWAFLGGRADAVTQGATTVLRSGADVLAEGDEAAARALARRAGGALLGETAADAALADDFLTAWNATPEAGRAAALEQRLTLRTFVSGHSLTLADVAVLQWAQGAGPALGVHGRRWREHVERVHPALRPRAAADEPSAKKSKTDEINLGHLGSFAKMELTNAVEGKVVVRFPPEPSG